MEEAEEEEEPVVLRRHRRQSSMNTTWQQEDTVYQQRRLSDLTWAAEDELQTIRSSGSRRPFSWGTIDASYRRSISFSIKSPRSHQECKVKLKGFKREEEGLLYIMKLKLHEIIDKLYILKIKIIAFVLFYLCKYKGKCGIIIIYVVIVN